MQRLPKRYTCDDLEKISSSGVILIDDFKECKKFIADLNQLLTSLNGHVRSICVFFSRCFDDSHFKESLSVFDGIF